MMHGIEEPEVRSYLAALQARLAAPDAPVPARQSPQAAPAQETQQTAPAQRHQDSTLRVVASCILLPFGVFLSGIGWFLAVAGLWMGTGWKRWEKIMGTVLLPGGVLGAGFLAILPWRMLAGTAQDAASGSNLILPGLTIGGTLALASLPILVAVYLLVSGLRRGPSQQ